MEELKRLREKEGYSQAGLAQLTGVTQQAIARWESGEVLPRADKLPLLAKVLGCTIDELFAPNQKAASAR